jgi:thiamine-phosphate pyrophosphorylase
MKLIIISSPAPVPNEHEIINFLFKEGLEIFHIHKPSFSKEEIKDFTKQIPSKYHSKIFLHSDFPKFHSLEELENYHPSKPAQEAFLSPVFDSISKQGYKSKFSDRLYTLLQFHPSLISAIRGKNIIALGGIDEDKIELVRKTGFAGAAVLGAIWNSKDPLEKFLRIKAKCQKTDLVR